MNTYEFCVGAGCSSIVLPQNWLFLVGYKKFREKLLKSDTWNLIARLGSGAFETISGEVVKAILITISRGDTSSQSGSIFNREGSRNIISAVDVSEPRSGLEKANALIDFEIKRIQQGNQLENPNNTIILETGSTLPRISDSAGCFLGICTGDYPRFGRNFSEIASIKDGWSLQRVTVQRSMHWGGMESVLLWENGSGKLFDFVEERLGIGASGTWLRGKMAWGNNGIAIKQMGDLPATLYSGELYNNNVAVLIPKEESILPAIWAFCASEEFNKEVRVINQTLAVDTQYMLSVPFDLKRWSKVAAEKYPIGLPKPYTNDPTQWIFHGHPCGSVVWDEELRWTAQGPLRNDNTVLPVAVARLLGYRWPAEQDPCMELAGEQRKWAERCEALLSYADEDGIVCIPPVRGEASASDRLLNLLAASYGDAWSNDTLSELLKRANHAGKTLETWLREKFFTQHCKLFQHRPFIWHIWDGLRDGFAALVNYHRLDTKLLEALIYTYLGDWISRQKQDIASGVDGGQERLAAAEALKKKLELILEGEAPYDIFVRWKPIEKQPIGWNPDLNDGVRLNIRPFMTVPDVGKKGAGVLRDKPNIKWNKDRGKDVESAPWYHVFKGDRINDHHLTIEEKKKTRSR